MKVEFIFSAKLDSVLNLFPLAHLFHRPSGHCPGLPVVGKEYLSTPHTLTGADYLTLIIDSTT